MYEVIIVGAGPAGMAAAVYAARKQINTLLISKDVGGQVNLTAGVENYMGYQFIEGPELMQKFEQQVRQFPIDQRIGYEVVRLSSLGKGFEVETKEGERYRGQAVLIASGKRSRPLNVPGEDKFVGRGVSYCAVCDGPLFRGKTVAVIGGGNSAQEAVNDMLKISPRVYQVSLTPLTADKVLIAVAEGAPNLSLFTEHEVVSIEGNTFVNAINIRPLKTGEVKRLEVSGVFVEIGLIPNSESVRGVVTLNNWGEIEVNRFCETGVPGLFAAGDVTNVPEKQIVVAAGEGAKAALQVHRYLMRKGS